APVFHEYSFIQIKWVAVPIMQPGKILRKMGIITLYKLQKIFGIFMFITYFKLTYSFGQIILQRISNQDHHSSLYIFFIFPFYNFYPIYSIIHRYIYFRI